MKHSHFGIIAIGLAFLLGAVPLKAAADDAPYVNPAVNGPEAPVYWVDLGGLYATYGAFPAAIKAYEKALTLDPSSSTIHFDLAIAHAELGQMDQALDLANKAITLDPQEGRYYYARAWILLKSGRQAEAMQDFSKAAELGNQDAMAYLNH